MSQKRFISTPAGSDDASQLLIIACFLLIVFGASPVVISCPPMLTYDFFTEHPGLQQLGRACLAVLIGVAILIVGRTDSEQGPGKVIRILGFALLAALLTDVHLFAVDVQRINWQFGQYQGALLHTSPPPDQYRFLPQGTLWWMCLGTGDFLYSYLAYRFFFTFMVCQAVYAFAREYLAARDAVIVVMLYGAFYPLSTRYYYGNLLDPMSHAVFLAALLYCKRGKFWCVFWLFALGVCVKETMLLIVPCYHLLNPGKLGLRDPAAWRRTALLAATGMLVFFACRVPFNFDFTFERINRTPELMIYSNLGMDRGLATSSVPVFQRLLHPVLFIFMWLPLIVWRRKWLPAPLFWTAIYFAPALYLSNLCFGWNYESRNFIPATVLLFVCTVFIVNVMTAGTRSHASTGLPDAKG